jgi:hypothetical protein
MGACSKLIPKRLPLKDWRVNAKKKREQPFQKEDLFFPSRGFADADWSANPNFRGFNLEVLIQEKKRVTVGFGRHKKCGYFAFNGL